MPRCDNAAQSLFICITRLCEKYCLAFSMLFCPSPRFKYLCVAFESPDETKSNIMIKEPTTLYIPKSSTPRASRILRDVKKLIAIRNIILTYRNPVFLMIFFVVFFRHVRIVFSKPYYCNSCCVKCLKFLFNYLHNIQLFYLYISQKRCFQ